MSDKNLLTEMAEAYLRDGWSSDALRANSAAGDMFSDAVADRMEQIEEASRG